jgi:peptidoglycan/xylan/chitin deacetylase (PgdA/CDA1 family)
MRWLSNSGVAVVSLDRLLELPAEANAIALTFDDAFKNFVDVAWPVLKDLGFPATVFVVSDHAGRTNAWSSARRSNLPELPLLDWDALGRLVDEGVTIGSHTQTHPNLRTAPPAAVFAEIDGAAARIRSELGVATTSFAYPYGEFDSDIANAVGRVHGIACTTEMRALRAPDDRLMLPRLDAYYFRRPGILERWGSGAFRRYVWLRAHGRRVRRVLEHAGAL